jgi:ketosteroid isomerase-like protein
MKPRWAGGAVVALLTIALGVVGAGAASHDAVADHVRAREVAFARTMADRDHTAFTTFVSKEALFVDATVLRGREAVAEAWKPLFEGAEAPFSWEPERVEVIGSGTLAISTGPVRNADGERIGTFNSTWRLEDDGEWRVVIDIGCPPCRPVGETPSAAAEE